MSVPAKSPGMPTPHEGAAPQHPTQSGVHSGDSVKVAVRVRPFNDREKANSLISVIRMSTLRKTVSVRNPDQKEGGTSTYPFDSVFWSMDGMDEDGKPPAQQQDVYAEIGKPLIAHAFNGYNSCLFAYGQTGSGKTHTMMGGGSFSADDPEAGVIPRLCAELFQVRAKIESGGVSKWTVEVGFIEVYNEKVSDLLADRKKDSKGKALKDDLGDVYVELREHQTKGVFLDGQVLKQVDHPADIEALIEMGNQVRHVAATKMNHRSSRSHAIFQIILKEERSMVAGPSGQIITTAGKNSRMNLVDLAGSERVSQSQVQGQQFAEAKAINLSLTTLGRVIDMLADMSKKGSSAWSTPPYRESKLTFLLKDSLGGNSKTFMIAAVSPSVMNIEESIGTLRYASRARDIVNTSKINEDPKAKRIRELEEQMESMRSQIRGGDPAYVADLEEKLRMMESEAQKRAADLHSLQLEREKNEMREKMLHASEAEKMELQAKADELERQMRQSKADAEYHAKQIQKLKEDQEAREQELLDKVRLKDEEVANMQKRLEQMQQGQEQLQKTMEDLDSVKKQREQDLVEMERQRALLESALQSSNQSQEQKEVLRKQNDELQAVIKRAELEAAQSSRLLDELHSIRNQQQLLVRENHALKIALDESSRRNYLETTHLFSFAASATSWHDGLLQNIIDESREAIAQLNCEYDAQQDKNRSLSDQLTDMEDNFNKQKDIAAALNFDMIEKISEADVATQQLADATARITELNEELSLSRQMFDSQLANAKQAMGADNAALQQQLAAANDSHAAAKAALEQQLADAAQAHSDAKAALEAELANANDCVSLLEIERLSLRTRVSFLREVLSDQNALPNAMHISAVPASVAAREMLGIA